MRVAYYVPEIPPVVSTTRYNHALGLAEYADEFFLLTHSSPPAPIVDKCDKIDILGAQVRPVRRTLGKLMPRWNQVQQAVQSVNRYLNKDDFFVTTFHYGPALTGVRANAKWVLDIYDDPYQYILNSPWSSHQLLARGLGQVLKSADRAVHTIHPSSPRLFGRDQRFAINGAPVTHITPAEKPSMDPLHCVWAGKPRLDRGMDPFLRALQYVDVSVSVDIYGEPYENAAQLADNLGVTNSVTFHGRRPHHEIVQTVARAHVGLCLLPYRIDWQYAYPIKIGEYLAGGAVPLCSPFYGMRELARGRGQYTDPTITSIAERLSWLAGHDQAAFEEMSADCRARGDAIAWADERSWFAQQALERDIKSR